MRGGTSKGVYFDERVLPTDTTERDRLVRSVMGSPDPRQIDGLGGADPLTSKVMLVAPSSEPDVDIDFTFGQVNIDEPVIDWGGNCGNLSSALGYFAIQKGFVEPVEPATTVSIRKTRTEIRMTNEISIEDGVPKAVGEHSISGVPGTGARVNVGLIEPGGERTGATLPTGSARDEVTVDGTTVECSLVDAGNPCVFIRASDFGLKGTEMPARVDEDERLIARIEELRTKLAVRAGIAPDRRAAAETHTLLPLVVFVSEPSSYTDYLGGTVESEDISLTARMVFNRQMHKAYAGTGSAATAVASQVDGSLVEDVAEPFETDTSRVTIRIDHPSGTMDAQVEPGDERVAEATYFSRTARTLMDGVAYARPE